VKNYAFLLVALAACAQQRPVVLAPVRMETPATAQRSGSVFKTQRDDPFATTNRIDWPGPNRYRSSSGVPGPDYWQQRADYTITASLDTSTAEAQRLGTDQLYQQLARHPSLCLGSS